ncbi:hypothetical protein BU17DRAFT_62305 [Hysterangium stoloniferum]|nr:hypothetical protein BU17DRAFT_62305 [Hysterangium stoloniferum]
MDIDKSDPAGKPAGLGTRSQPYTTHHWLTKILRVRCTRGGLPSGALVDAGDLALSRSPGYRWMCPSSLSTLKNQGWDEGGVFGNVRVALFGQPTSKKLPSFHSPSEDPFLVPTVPTESDFRPRTLDNERERKKWWNEHLRSGFKDPMWILDTSSDSQIEKPTFVLPSLFQFPALENASFPYLPLVADPSTGCPTTAVAKSPAPSSQSVNNHGAPRPPPGQLKRSSWKPRRVPSSSSQDGSKVADVACHIQVTLLNHTHHIVAGITYPKYLAIQSNHRLSITMYTIPSSTEEPKKGEASDVRDAGMW